LRKASGTSFTLQVIISFRIEEYYEEQFYKHDKKKLHLPRSNLIRILAYNYQIEKTAGVEKFRR